MNAYINLLKNNKVTADIVEMMIKDHEQDHKRMKGLYERYQTAIEGVPILQRKAIEYEDFETDAVKRIDNKVNNRLNNAFDADIVDTKVGYMFGVPIVYSVGEAKQLEKPVTEFNKRNNIEDADSEWGKMAAICGYASRLAYVDREGKERIKNINPWETIILSDGDITEPQFGLRYYQVYDWQDGQKVSKRKAEFYDDRFIYYFSSAGEEKLAFDDKELHMFDYCPLFGVPNNKEMLGDAEKVLKLIDAYDRTISDASNEIEQYRLAYLILKGLGADDETLERVRQAGIFELFDEKDDVKYLTKDINDALIEHHLDRLEENILRFAKSVNFSDESFGGQVTGVAMRYKLLALENKCITMERKMTAAQKYQYKVLCSAWSKKSNVQKDDYLEMEYQYTRNLPSNIKEEAETTSALRGHVSEETRLGMLSFVPDPEKEKELMKKEEEEFGDRLESLGGATSGSSDEEKTCPECGGDGKVTSDKTGKQITCQSCGGDGVIGA